MKSVEQLLEEMFELLITRTRLEREQLRHIYLAQFGDRIIPFCSRYMTSAKAEVRSDLLEYICRYARSRPEVADFAVRSLQDRSKVVRRSACAILAYTQEPKWIGILTSIATASGEPTATHARNAIHAIQEQNPNLFYPEYDAWIVSLDDPRQPVDSDVDYYIKKCSPGLVDPLLRILGTLYGKYSKP